MSYPKLSIFPLFHPVSSGAEKTVARRVEQVINRDPFRNSCPGRLSRPAPFFIAALNPPYSPQDRSIVGPQYGVDPLDFLPQRPPLPGLLLTAEAHMRSVPLTARSDPRACAGFGVANGRQVAGPEFVYDLRDSVRVVRRLKEDYKDQIKALIVLNISYKMAFLLQYDWVFYQIGVLVSPLLRFFLGFWFRLICPQK